MYKLEYFEYIEEYGFGGQSNYVALVFLHDDVAGIFPLEIEYAIHAWPFGLGYVFPQPIIDLENVAEPIK